jgi:hypothetical protein
MLRLRAGTATLLIGPRAAAGVHGGRYCLDSEAEIRQRLTTALHDPASREAMRRFWAHWQGDARVSGIKDHTIVDRIARMGVRGPLIVFLITDISLHRRDTSAARRKQVTEALQTRNRAMPWQGPVRAPAPIAVSMVKPVATPPPTMVDRSVVGGPKRLIGDWTIAEKLTAVVMFTADSRKLSDDARQQLKQMLSDPTFVAWLVGSLLVWFVSQFFVVGEILDMLLAGAALVLSGVGIVFAVQSLIGAAHLIGQFVEAVRTATDENDLKRAADILAEIIVMIGITVLIAALTHATTRATSSGLEAKGSVKKPPPERAPTVEKLQERPKPSQDASSSEPVRKPEVSYKRPSSYRKGVRDKVWENAKDDDGLVRDPQTGQVMDPSEPWDMGHEPGYEFRKHQASAMERGISREEFLDEHNNPDHYRPELPSSNRSHRGENMTDDYFGD